MAKVGLTAFGFWSVLLSILVFVQATNGGVPTLASRFIAQFHAEGNDQGIRQVIALTCLTMALFGALVVAIAVGVVALLPADLISDVPGWRGSIVGAAVGIALTTFGYGLAAVSRGLHRWENEAVVTPLQQLTIAIATVILLESGWGVDGLGWAAAVGGLTLTIGFAVSAHRNFGLALRGARPTRELWSEFWRQGLHLQIVAIVAAVNAQADRFLLLAFAPLSFIGAYSLGQRMAVALRGFPIAAFGALITHISSLHGTDGMTAVKGAYERAVDGLASYGVAGLLVLYGAMYPAVLAWLGADFTISAAAAVIVGLGYAVNVLTGPGTATAVACGRAQLDRDYSVLGLVINLVLTPIFGIAFGPWGVAAATTVGMTLSSVWLFRRVDSWLGTSIWRVLGDSPQAWRNLLIGVVLGAAAVAIAVAAAPASRLANLGIAVAIVAIGLLLLGLPFVRERRAARQLQTVAPA